MRLITAFADAGKEGPYSRKESKELHGRFVLEHRTIPFRRGITDAGREHFCRKRYENIHLDDSEPSGTCYEDKCDCMAEYLIGCGGCVTILEPEEPRYG
jgi:hypothetical protein